VDEKTDFLDRRLLGGGSGTTELDGQKKKFRQTQQLKAETDERH